MSNEVKAGAWTALWTFIALFGLTLLGVAQDVAQWSSTSGSEPLPGLSVVGYGFVSAVIAAASGLVGTIVRWAQSKSGVGTVPTYGE